MRARRASHHQPHRLRGRLRSCRRHEHQVCQRWHLGHDCHEKNQHRPSPSRSVRHHVRSEVSPQASRVGGGAAADAPCAAAQTGRACNCFFTACVSTECPRAETRRACKCFFTKRVAAECPRAVARRTAVLRSPTMLFFTLRSSCAVSELVVFGVFRGGRGSEHCDARVLHSRTASLW